MKKLVSSVLIAILVLSSTLAISVSADSGINPFYLYTMSMDNSIIMTGNTASCKSILTGLSSATEIQMTQYLQRWNGSSWANVSNASWSDSTTGRRLSMTNEKSGLASGTYRVYAVATVYSGSSSEKVTGYSVSVSL